MDLFPSFWSEMGRLLESGVTVLHQTVLDELKRHKDLLVPWIAGLDGVKPFATSDEAIGCYNDVCAWAEDQTYTRLAIREFETDTRADAWLCAEALASGMTIVTYETHSNSANRVKIPDVCAGLGIECMGGFDFMRMRGFRF